MKVTFIEIPRVQEGATAYPEIVYLLEIDLPTVPRPGEQVRLGARTYKVKHVCWTLAEGSYDETGNGYGCAASASVEVFVEQ